MQAILYTGNRAMRCQVTNVVAGVSFTMKVCIKAAVKQKILKLVLHTLIGNGTVETMEISNMSKHIPVTMLTIFLQVK